MDNSTMQPQPQGQPMQMHRVKMNLWIALLRMGMGWLLLWAFFDKLFGLGFATTSDKSWLNGGSPTSGFLLHGTHGWFQSAFSGLAGHAWVDWLFMIGLFCIGLSLMLGIAKKLSTMTGSLLFLLMWLATFPPTQNPLLDDHFIYILVLQLLLQLRSGEHFGLALKWNDTALVKRFSFLR